MPLSLRSLALAAPLLLLACAPRSASAPSPTPAPTPFAQPEPTPAPAAPTAADDTRCHERVEQARGILSARGEDGAREAADLLEAALADAPRCLDALWELGWARQSAGQLDDALAAWDRLQALAPDYPELAGDKKPRGSRPSKIPWAELAARTFATDVLRCERCGFTPLRVVEVVAAPTGEQLAAVGVSALVAGRSRPHRSRGPPGQLALRFETRAA